MHSSSHRKDEASEGVSRDAYRGRQTSLKFNVALSQPLIHVARREV